MAEEEDPNVKAAREKMALEMRLLTAKVTSQAEFDKMVADEWWTEDKVALLKSRATELFKRGFLELAAGVYTRAIGIHACKGTTASHVLYGNRSACRSGFGDYQGALDDARECIRLSPEWAKGYVRLGAALHGLHRLDEAERAYQLGLTHDASLSALTEGLNDVLLRRKAAGGRWSVSRADELSVNTQTDEPEPEHGLSEHKCLELGIAGARGTALAPTDVPSTASGGDDEEGSILYVCDSGNGRVVALDPMTWVVRFVVGRAGAGDGELDTPLSISAHGDLLAIADSANYRVGIYTRCGVFIRHIGERASKFARVARAGHFARPPTHVALTDGHLFVLEGGGSKHVHVLAPESGEASGLLLPPFNARPPAGTRAVIPPDCPLNEATTETETDRLGVNGCLVGMCVRDDDLYCTTTWHGDQDTRVLHLSRTPPAGAGHEGNEPDSETGKGAATAEGKEELAYKKGFLIN